MNLEVAKFNPWNWFRDEEGRGGRRVPAHRRPGTGGLPSALHRDPFLGFHREIDRLFDEMFGDFALPGLWSGSYPHSGFGAGFTMPVADIKETRDSYKITVEIPGVDEDDVKLELADNCLTISGEKKYEKEDKDERYHSIERSYGTFRRVLSLPEDAKEDGIEASFKKGLLKITVPRREEAERREDVKQIEIKKG